MADEDVMEAARAAAQGDPQAMAELVRLVAREEGPGGQTAQELAKRLDAIEARLQSLADLLERTLMLERSLPHHLPQRDPFGSPRWPMSPGQLAPEPFQVRPTWIGTGPGTQFLTPPTIVQPTSRPLTDPGHLAPPLEWTVASDTLRGRGGYGPLLGHAVGSNLDVDDVAIDCIAAQD